MKADTVDVPVDVPVDVITPIPNRHLTISAAPWMALERMVQELRSCDQTAAQIDAALGAIVQEMAVEGAFFHVGNAAQVAGRPGLSEQWCADFLHIALSGAEELEEVIWKRGGRVDGPQPLPLHAALVRVGTVKPGWLGMLRFTADRPFHANDLRFLRFAHQLLANQHHHARTRVRLRESMVGMIRSLSAAIDAKDPYTCGHSERVARIAVVLGEHMGLSEPEVHQLFLAGVLHDIGKIGIPDDILLKDGPLTPAEFEYMKTHPVVGEQIVSRIPPFAQLRAGIRHHHERWDGRGYPDRLARHSIPLVARILAVADTCDALMSHRRYRPSRTPPEIDAVLNSIAGTQLDDEVVAHFMDCRNAIYPPIYQKGIGDSAYHAISSLLDGSSSDILSNPR